ncbi:MAG: hypothetical protein J5529_02755 [Prevotella sp.]|nr:hypothetical protein [Prevotella sp.]
MNTFYSTIFISVIVFIIFIFFQIKFFAETRKYRNLFNNFFAKNEEYATYNTVINGEDITQLKLVGASGSDLNTLIAEINHYVAKTKGTTDFAVIQNKVERKLNMRYDQSVAKLAFPTYLGLMGTFAGVFLGISMFIGGFDGAGDITDESIKNLLFGVLVSMSTSLIGLFLTTINNALAGDSRKNIEEDKNAFYDFVQTELMPSLDVSMVLAITRLHETVDRFEPAFDGVINRFQTTFDKCTKAFGNSFEKNVTAVAAAVSTMGKNMDKINENINLQQQLISTLRSGEMVRGMDKYIEAAEHFVSITKSLDKFEEVRRMMLAAAQEAINLQNSYTDALKIPREVAVRVNLILERIKTFEENVNRIGGSLNNRQILGNDVVETIREQVNAIRKKDKIALKYFEIADGKLSDVFEEQTKVLNEMNSRHKEAIAGQIAGFEEMLREQTSEIKKQHGQFIEQMQMHLNVEEIHKDFTNLRKLNEVVEQLKRLTQDPVKADELSKKLRDIQAEIAKIEITESKGGFGSIFGGGSSNSEEVRKLKGENIRLQADIDSLRRQVTRILSERQNASQLSASSSNPALDEEPKSEGKPAEEQKKGGWFTFGKRN